MTLPVTAAESVPQWFSDALAQPLNSGYFDRDGCRLHYLQWVDRAESAAASPLLEPPPGHTQLE